MHCFWQDLAVIAHFPTKWPSPARSHCFNCSFKLFIVMIHLCLFATLYLLLFPYPLISRLPHLSSSILLIRSSVHTPLLAVKACAPCKNLVHLIPHPHTAIFPIFFSLQFFFKRIPVFPSPHPDIVKHFFYVKTTRYCW